MRARFKCGWCNHFYEMGELAGLDLDANKGVCIYCMEKYMVKQDG
jgi:hypothetical protein